MSVGIELQGTDKTSYTTEQYKSLNKLVNHLRTSYSSLQNITWHENIAAGRKTNAGVGFDWERVNIIN